MPDSHRTWRALVPAVVLAAAVHATNAHAQEALQPAGAPPAMVGLSDVLGMFDTSPIAIAQRATLHAFAADRITAATRPNPSVSYGGLHLVSGMDTGAVTQHQVVVEQPLLLFKQRDARIASADAALHVEQARVAEALARRRAEVRQAFATLLSRQEQLSLIQASVTDLERVEAIVRGRAQAGERSRYDLARIETETARLRVDMLNAETDVADASGALAALLGRPSWRPRAVGTLAVSADVPADPDRLWMLAQERRPALIVLRQRQAAARGGLTLARRERLPVLAVSGGTQVTREVNGTSAFFGVSMPVPLFDKGRGPIARAVAEIDASKLALDAELAEARAEIDRVGSVLTQRRAALDRLERNVVQGMPALRQMAEDAYREGTADILELLDAMRSLRDIQRSRIQQLGNVKLAEEAVVAATGLEEPQGRP